MTDSYKHDLVTVADMDEDQVLHKIKLAQLFQRGKTVHFNRPTYAMNLFFENSTRTHTSFEMAERRLGIQVLQFNAGSSSVTKGETLADTIKTLQAIGVDIAVIRHPENEYYRKLLDENLKISVVNGGDGSGQHPSQSLLDMMTIYQEFGTFKNLNVGIIGDLNHSRVARSNMELLTKLGAHVSFAGPDQWYDQKFEDYGQRLTVDELAKNSDIVMLLRVQKERLGQELADFDAASYHEQFGLTKDRYHTMKDHAIIMHPAPVNRGIEIDSDLVEADKSRIFKQMTNGMYMRMAILTDVLVNKGIVNKAEIEGID
ncbi:aspartate carbamoyltransferase catalytic subunit [Fructilactobacillus fructivorans]|uniref:Aspartate carbamoyltransferase n=1 Tax=Fructilactobacillus fructivorans TaxID=1614 RepID=A0A0C1M7F9_9LACO|nr:aspartate carbamoyltransferase catalytic subunit [Fructilactobacillus fructivorans]KID42374.1 Aspartate carbamoyltransferase [Fructilactobacillus fructivorans]MCT0151009.1 aspartate carbamoyltransferase catalytic subunit [Fructilactobacillus fructivorans]MCT2867433.1 aspartate carbamoyltransferase catalytic subunit [Fructilactobacillus fructivorans]MCT2869048.1 aspartate carbamoyltransferase catalytic subunit [Fructilactobacillus fructivorans]MCT2873232.1 aspartate carbamoyltransferase cata